MVPEVHFKIISFTQMNLRSPNADLFPCNTSTRFFCVLKVFVKYDNVGPTLMKYAVN